MKARSILFFGALAAIIGACQAPRLNPTQLATLLAPTSTPPPPSAPPAPEQPDVGAALQRLLDAWVRQQRILGMAMAVRLADGTVVFRRSGYTDPTRKNAWSLDTQSALGSVTKTFTAVIIMQLVEEGKLSLDDTIDTWFTAQPNADKITVRMLLSHTSGLSNAILPENERDPKWSHEWAPLDLVAEANRNGPVDVPGSKIAHYSNAGYFLLGLIIEKITGNSWKQEFRSRIIGPLNLEDTTFLDVEGVWGGSIVEGYARTSEWEVTFRAITPSSSVSRAPSMWWRRLLTPRKAMSSAPG